MQGSLRTEFDQKIISDLKLIAHRSKNHEIFNTISELINDLKHTNHTYQNLNIQNKRIDDLNSAFYERLSTAFPNLTQTELELCSMLRLKLNGKEIASLRNINPESVKKSRQRLRRKLGLNVNQNLYEFMAQI